MRTMSLVLVAATGAACSVQAGETDLDTASGAASNCTATASQVRSELLEECGTTADDTEDPCTQDALRTARRAEWRCMFAGSPPRSRVPAEAPECEFQIRDAIAEETYVECWVDTVWNPSTRPSAAQRRCQIEVEESFRHEINACVFEQAPGF